MLKRLFLVTLLLSLVVSGSIGIAIFLVGDFDSTHIKLLGTTACVGAFSLTGLASATGVGAKRWWWWPLPYLGIAASAAALTVIILLIWDLWNTVGSDRQDFKLVSSLVVMALSIAHLSLLASVNRKSVLLKWCRTVTCIIVVAVAVFLILGILNLPDFDEEWRLYLRLLGVLLILDVLGTLFVGIFSVRNPTPTRKGLRRSMAPTVRSTPYPYSPICADDFPLGYVRLARPLLRCPPGFYEGQDGVQFRLGHPVF